MTAEVLFVIKWVIAAERVADCVASFLFRDKGTIDWCSLALL